MIFFFPFSPVKAERLGALLSSKLRPFHTAREAEEILEPKIIFIVCILLLVLVLCWATLF